MSGYNDPFSHFFNLPTMCWLAWAGFLGVCMLACFVGFDNGGFLHKVEEKFGIFPKQPSDEEH